MSAFRVDLSRQQQPQTTPFAAPRPMTRKEKTNSFLSEVVPMALGIGLQGAAESQNAQSTRGSGTRSAIATGATATGASAASAWSSAAGWMQGIMGAANIALSWGRSSPAAGASSGMAVGATIGTCIAPGIGTAIGAAVGAFAGGLLGSIKTGKHKDQVARDQVRGFLQQTGVLDPSYSIKLADGSLYNIGIDGGPKAEFGGRRPYETDPNNPLTKYAVSWMNPIMDLVSQGNEKIKTDFVGYFANAALSNARSLNDVRQNVNAIISQFGISDEAVAQTVIQAANSGQLDQGTARAYLSGMDERRNPKFMGDFNPTQPSVA